MADCNLALQSIRPGDVVLIGADEERNEVHGVKAGRLFVFDAERLLELSTSEITSVILCPAGRWGTVGGQTEMFGLRGM